MNMSMLKNFLEIGCDSALFEGLEISEEKALCEAYMGKFPVISISLKDVNGRDYETARSMMCSIIGNEAMRFSYLLESDCLTEREKIAYEQMVMPDTTGKESFAMPDSVLMGILKTLSTLLVKYYGQKAIILIDEYDVPLDKAMQAGYYEEMVLSETSSRWLEGLQSRKLNG